MPHKDMDKRKEYQRERYLKHKADMKRKIKIAAKKRAKLYKIKLVKEKGGKCNRCGFNKHIVALQFHHKDDNKVANVSTMLQLGYSYERVKTEADKCELICANCHMIEHLGDMYDEYDYEFSFMSRKELYKHNLNNGSKYHSFTKDESKKGQASSIKKGREERNPKKDMFICTTCNQLKHKSKYSKDKYNWAFIKSSCKDCIKLKRKK
jgi:hypothetical protein